MKKSRVLIVDALNAFFRGYIVDPSLSSNGQPVGGIRGFLRILQTTVRDTKPDKIVIACDGQGGSRRRRTVNSNYKQGRKPIRLNRAIRNLTEDEEVNNKVWQQKRLMEYLNNMPVTQTFVPEIEADDVIAYISQMPSLKESQKVIMSQDQDFFQLCDDKTVLFRPIKKQVLNKKSITDEYGIHPVNFALARAMAGDKSDNLPGVPGVGLATLAKRMPFLAEDRSVFIDEVIDYCENVEKKLKFHNAILEHQDRIEENYQIMQLYAPSMSPQAKEQVRWAIENSGRDFNKTEIVKMMAVDGFGMGQYDSWADLFCVLKKISVANDN